MDLNTNVICVHGGARVVLMSTFCTDICTDYMQITPTVHHQYTFDRKILNVKQTTRSIHRNELTETEYNCLLLLKKQFHPAKQIAIRCLHIIITYYI